MAMLETYPPFIVLVILVNEGVAFALFTLYTEPLPVPMKIRFEVLLLTVTADIWSPPRETDKEL